MSFSRYSILLAILFTFFITTLAGAVNLPSSLFPNMEKASFTKDKQPLWLHGDLGTLETPTIPQKYAFRTLSNSFEASVKQYFVDRLNYFNLTQDDGISVFKSTTDSLGINHIRILQKHLGLPVEGADAWLHVGTKGKVRTMNGYLAGNILQGTNPHLESDEAIDILKEHLDAMEIELLEPATLVYRASPNTKTRLAWKIQLNWSNTDNAAQEKIYVDAENGEVLARINLLHNTLYRKIYDGNNNTSMPGTLLFNEGGSSSDSIAMEAYDNTGIVYDFMKDIFNRNSFDNNGGHLKSTVHYLFQVGYGQYTKNNAAWSDYHGSFMFGDGDGNQFAPLTGALDVAAHELFHAVTSRSANLEYKGQSGALNEGMSDVFGVACEAWDDGVTSSDTWKLGEDVFTPGKSGDALRYMNDPTKDGNSKDYYPERYTGTADNGGVHWNSGICNLSFYLLVKGGKHPRGKSNTVVNGIGIEKAQAIFYKALTQYLTSTSNFEAARNATAQAAKDLYGTTEVASVHAAWDAVGVPGGVKPEDVELFNNDVKGNLNASTNNEIHFFIDIPSDASNLTFQTSGGSGDADLHVRFNAKPTSSQYDYRPYKDGNTETVNIDSPSSGKYYIMLRAYKDFSGLTLSVSYDTKVDPPQCNAIYTNDFESGAGGWYFSSSDSTSSTGDWTVGVPDAESNGGVVTQLGEDHTPNGKNAFYTAPNGGGAGSDDVDGGVCTAYSDIIDVSDYPKVELSLWYFHGQRDGGDDRDEDYFKIDLSTDGGASYSRSLVAIGDVKTNAQWTQVNVEINNPGQLKFRIQASDGSIAGDLIEGGIDDVVICVPE